MKKPLLKNKLVLALSLMLFTAVAPSELLAQKKVLFVCNSAFNTTAPVTTSSLPDADPFIKELQADPTNFTVTTKLTTDGASIITEYGSIAAVYAAFDLVVSQESFGSASAIWKPAGLLGIKNITIPVIYTKGYALRTGLALTDVVNVPTGNIAASAVLGSKLAVTVPPANQTNPLFTGIDFSGGNDIAIFNNLASDKGLAGDATSTKAVDITYNENITNIATGDLANQLTTELASIVPATGVPATVNPNSTMCINDIPGGTYFGTAGTDMLPSTSRMMFFAYNYGALASGFSDGVSSNVTANGLKIFKNAAKILTGLPLGTNDFSVAADGISVSPNPTSGLVTVNGAAVKTITVFDTTGKQVSASKTNSVDLSNQAKGLYLLKVQTEKGATTEKVVVE